MIKRSFITTFLLTSICIFSFLLQKIWAEDIFVGDQSVLINDLWSSDENGDFKKFFKPGETVIYNAEFSFTDKKSRRVSIGGVVSGDVEESGRILKKWHTILPDIKQILEPGTHRVSWTKKIPDKALLENEATMEVRLSVGIFGTSGRDKKEFIFSVTNKILEKLEVNPSSVALLKDETLQLEVSGLFQDGSVVDLTLFSEGTKYVSSNPGVVTVDENGLITALEEGVSVVGISNTNVAFSVDVIVTKLFVMDLTPTGKTFFVSDEDFQLLAIATSEDGDLLRDITDSESGTIYESSDMEVLTVDEDGLVDIKGGGEAAIIATNGELIGRSEFRVSSLTLEVTSPQDLTTVNEPLIKVEGVIKGEVKEILVNDSMATVIDGRFTAEVLLDEGINVINVKALDLAESVFVANVNVVLDTTAPRVSINSPEDGSTSFSSNIAVSGIIHDFVKGLINAEGPKVNVNGIGANIFGGTFCVPDVPLESGENSIEAVVEDQVGNTAVASINVNFVEPTGDRIEIVSGNNQRGIVGDLLDDVLVVKVVNEDDSPAVGQNVIFKVVENNGAMTIPDENLDEDSLKVLSGGKRNQWVGRYLLGKGRVVKLDNGDNVVSQVAGDVLTMAVKTGEEGLAAVKLRLGTKAGEANNKIEATAPGFDGKIIFVASGESKIPDKINVASGIAQSGAVWEALPEPFVVIVTDDGHNCVHDIPVTFKVVSGGGSFDGEPTIQVNTDINGFAVASFTLGAEEGLSNNVVEAGFDSMTGLPAIFEASAFIPGAIDETRLSGVVLDNQNNPIPGVTIRIKDSELSVIVDEEGQFEINGVPVGSIVIEADGSTASASGTYPTLLFHLTTISGINNTLGMPIFLLLINTSVENADSENSNVDGEDFINSNISAVFVTADDNEEAILTLPNVPGFSLGIKPGSITFPDGSRDGVVSVTQVNSEKVPMAPNNGLQPRFIITIQPSGALFDPPGVLTLPNTDGLLPGEQTEMYSFDNDMGRFVSIGLGTVSKDGMVVTSNPGVGIFKGGWHCGGNPSRPGSGESLRIISVNGPRVALINESVSYIARATARGIRWSADGGAPASGGPSAGASDTFSTKFAATGDHDVKAMCNTAFKKVITTVLDIKIKEISQICVGDSKMMMAEGAPSGGRVTNWQTSNTEVATINTSTGEISGVKVGSVTVTVDYVLRGKTATSEPFSVGVGGDNDVLISPIDITLCVGDKKEFTATICSSNDELREIASNWSLNPTDLGTFTTPNGQPKITFEATKAGMGKIKAVDLNGDVAPGEGEIRVVDIDLSFEEVSEDDEESKGGFICGNDDFKNSETSIVGETLDKGEQVLKKLSLKIEPEGFNEGYVTFEAAKGGAKIRVWEDKDKTKRYHLPQTVRPSDMPKELWLEGVDASLEREVELKLTYQKDEARCEDKVNVTVVKLEFVNNEERDDVDLLPLFNPNPVIKLDAIADPAITEKTKITVKGTVKDFITPIEKVLVNGKLVNVTQKGSGNNELGPFDGEFSVEVDLIGRNTLIEVSAINALNNLGFDSALIVVKRGNDFKITDREVKENDGVDSVDPKAPKTFDDFIFNIELKDASETSDEVQVELDTSVEKKTIVLKKDATGVYKSKDLILVPENIKFAASVSTDVKDSRIKAKFGKKPKITYKGKNIECDDKAIVKGILFLKGDSAIDFAESGTDADFKSGNNELTFLVEVGAPGNSGSTINVDLFGVDEVWKNLKEPADKDSFSPVTRNIELKRVSDDKKLADYHHYKMDDKKPLMALRTSKVSVNDKINDMLVMYNGGIKASFAGDLVAIEPAVGLEIVAENGTSGVFRAADLPAAVTDFKPNLPIVLASDGAPRPTVEITSATYDNKGAIRGVGGAVATIKPKIKIKGKVKDFIADNTLGEGANIKEIFINPIGTATPGTKVNLMIARNKDADPPIPFEGTFDTDVELEVIPDLTNVTANLQNFDGRTALTIAQQMIIVKAVNAIGNWGYDSVAIRIEDPNGDGVNPAAGGGRFTASTITQREATLYDVKPDLYYVNYHNPFEGFKSVNSFDVKLTSKDFEDKDVKSRNIKLEQKYLGNMYRFGPFLTGNRDPRVPDDAPAIPEMESFLSVKGGGKIVAEAPGKSKPDEMKVLGLELLVDLDDADFAGKDNRKDYLPTGSAAKPDKFDLIVKASPADILKGKSVNLELRNVTSYRGHASNAPRNRAANNNREDYSFDKLKNEKEKKNLVLDDKGEAKVEVFSKDWGGMVTIQSKIDLRGDKSNPQPAVLLELPVDSDGDTLPDVWEGRGKVGEQRDGLVDLENEEVNSATVIHDEKGDGFTAFEEYRGFHVTSSGGTKSVFRSDKLPMSFGVAGDSGPKKKDLFVLYKSSVKSGGAGNLAMSTTDAQIFNVAWHEIQNGDLLQNPPANSFTGHNHSINFNGDNDSLNITQHVMHVRDNTGLAIANQTTALGQAPGFRLSTGDIRINQGLAGPYAPAAGHVNAANFSAAIRNGNTVFHEMGHNIGLVHAAGRRGSAGNNLINIALDPANNTAINGVGVGTVTAEGVVLITMNTYVDVLGNNTTRAYFYEGTQTAAGCGRGGRAEAAQVTVNGAVWPITNVIFNAANTDAYCAPTRVRLISRDNPVPVGAVLDVRARLFFPDLLDWTDFDMPPNGFLLQQNLNALQYNIVVGGTVTVHKNQVRVKSSP